MNNHIMNDLGNYPFISGNWWDWKNLFSLDILFGYLYPIFSETLSLVGNFLLFKSLSIGLNVLLEIDFNQKSKVDGGRNE